MVYLQRNPLVYYDGLRDLGIYELYKLIQHKINDVFQPFIGTHIRVECLEDIYYELYFCGQTHSPHLIREVARSFGQEPEVFLKRVKDEVEKICMLHLGTISCTSMREIPNS